MMCEHANLTRRQQFLIKPANGSGSSHTRNQLETQASRLMDNLQHFGMVEPFHYFILAFVLPHLSRLFVVVQNIKGVETMGNRLYIIWKEEALPVDGTLVTERSIQRGCMSRVNLRKAVLDDGDLVNPDSDLYSCVSSCVETTDVKSAVMSSLNPMIRISSVCHESPCWLLGYHHFSALHTSLIDCSTPTDLPRRHLQEYETPKTYEDHVMMPRAAHLFENICAKQIAFRAPSLRDGISMHLVPLIFSCIVWYPMVMKYQLFLGSILVEK